VLSLHCYRVPENISGLGVKHAGGMYVAGLIPGVQLIDARDTAPQSTEDRSLRLWLVAAVLGCVRLLATVACVVGFSSWR